MTIGKLKPCLFSPGILGRYEIPHRIVMSPLTRARTNRAGIPSALNAEYYQQRASSALIISEATHISAQGVGWVDAPGLFTPEQVAGWKKVTAAVHNKAVHEKDGLIFAQLWHMGKLSHPSFQPNGELPVSSSAIKADGEANTYDGAQPNVTPRALETHEIADVVEQYRIAARNAMDAGFDGVELHAAGGYLPAQFLSDSSNKRTDAYGGSIENRVRFVIEVVEALSEIWGGDRVGIKISPGISFSDAGGSNINETAAHLVERLNRFDLAYLHVLERIKFPGQSMVPDVDHQALRKIFNGPYMANGNYTKETAQRSIEDGKADFVAFGRPFIANPDLPQRYRKNAPLNEPDGETFNGGDHRGYTDYPTL